VPGQSVSSCFGNVSLVHQTDGNVVLYDRLGQALWHTGTWGNDGAYLAVQDDCNLVLYSAGGTRLWASNSSCQESSAAGGGVGVSRASLRRLERSLECSSPKQVRRGRA
jgi:hypothetical protein